MDAGQSSPEERLVLLAKDGNLEAFNSLVDRFQRAVYGLCYRMLGNREAAEDATQETFLSAYRAISRFEGGNAGGWLLRIAANESRDELRRRRRRDGAASLDEMLDREDLPVEVPDPSPGAEALLAAHEAGGELEVLLLRLPFEYRQALVLVDVYGFRYDEVADLTKASLGTVKSRVHRGRERLRKLILSSGELSPPAVRQNRYDL